MIKCTQCGFDNPPGHLYCTRCKLRLNLEQFTREYFSSYKKHFHFHYSRQILSWLVAVVIAGSALALWPDRIDAVKASSAEQGQAQSKLILLQKGLAVTPIMFSEKEVDILFNYFLQGAYRRSERASEPTAVYAGRVTIRPKTLTVHLIYRLGPWLLGPVTVGPFWLTYKVTGVPEKWSDGLRFAALNGAVGHLPLPFLGRNLGMTRLKRLFLPFKNARSFLSSLEVVEMRKGNITISGAYQPRPNFEKK